MSETSGYAYQASTRAEFMGSEGFALYTDFNRRMLTELIDAPIDLIEAGDDFAGPMHEYSKLEEDGINSANFGLRGVTHMLTGRHPMFTDTNLLWGECLPGLGVSQQDKDAAESMGVVLKGFGDREFTWHFAAGIAAAAVHSFVREGKISEKQASELTLGDWADLIGSSWFSKLMHQLAFTRGGFYREFGHDLSTYAADAMEEHLSLDAFKNPSDSEGRYHLKIQEQFDPFDERVYLTTELNPATRSALRLMMREAKRTGCPVARRSARLPKDVFESNPHVTALVEAGILTAHEEQDGVHVQVYQSYTAIDRTLEVFARQLDTYDMVHGTPLVTAEQRLVHQRRPATGVLYHDSEHSLEENDKVLTAV